MIVNSFHKNVLQYLKRVNVGVGIGVKVGDWFYISEFLFITAHLLKTAY